MLLITTGAAQTVPVRQKASFNQDWQFHLGDVEGAHLPNFDDSQWRTLNVPHDWSIELPFSETAPAGPGGGALPGGLGWYRKTFTPSSADINGKQVYIAFDGVYMNSEVFINGLSLGVRPFGYISFQYDLTPYLLPDQENVIAVKVNNADQPNSRWYSGSGIYRNTWITTVDPLHVAQWGTYVTTPVITNQMAQVDVATTVSNHYKHGEEFKVSSILYNAQGDVVAQLTSPLQKVDAGATAELKQELTVKNPIRWSLENPYLYTLHTEVYKKDKLVDNYETTVGIRDFYFDAAKGFFLNGQHTKIKGVCLHHDLGALGAAFNTRAMERQLEIMKEMGVNSIRVSHNPPATEVLELCDRMGIIVQDETFDIWR